jgi:hypothetical protein
MGFLAGLEIPQAHGPIGATGNAPTAIRRKRDAVDSIGMPIQTMKELPRLHLPKTNPAGRVTGEDPAIVGGKSHAENFGIILINADGLAGVDIPQAQGLIRASGHGSRTAFGEDHAVDRFRMARKAVQAPAGGCVPEPQPFVIAAGQGAPAVRG